MKVYEYEESATDWNDMSIEENIADQRRRQSAHTFTCSPQQKIIMLYVYEEYCMNITILNQC